jgi:Glycosyltransferase like family 2
MTEPATARLEHLGPELRRVRGDKAATPDATIVIPVNARADLENVLNILDDIADYDGRRTFEVVLVINNYPANGPPEQLETYALAGPRTVGVPAVWRKGEVVSFTARIPGAREAASPLLIHFDADCRLRNATALLDWYVDRFEQGAAAAYTYVGYYDLRPLWSVRARIAVHHGARWAKRTILRIPTVRGSNYAVARSLFLSLYDQGLLTDDLNVGPAVKASGGSVPYGEATDLHVFTSGRRFRGGWLRLGRYLWYRTRYNLRVLPVRAVKPGKSRNPFHEKPLR